MCDRLLDETGVAILPGSDFGRPEPEYTASLAYVDFDGERALEAASMLGKNEELGESFLREYCGRMLEAVDRINEFNNAMS